MTSEAMAVGGLASSTNNQGDKRSHDSGRSSLLLKVGYQANHGDKRSHDSGRSSLKY